MAGDEDRLSAAETDLDDWPCRKSTVSRGGLLRLCTGQGITY
jgi:hypothetical protein